jgi:uncharacterized protein YegJ (DUF2314 family)
MKSARIVSLRLLASLVWLGCASALTALEDRVIGVGKDDPEMNKAMADARAHLPHFWQVMAEAKNGEEDFSIKVRITDGKEVEYFWCNELKVEKGVVTAMIDNDPELVKTVESGQRIPVKEPDIVDWFYMKHDKMIGNYTSRPLMKSMSKEEKEYLKETLGPLPE